MFSKLHTIVDVQTRLQCAGSGPMYGEYILQHTIVHINTFCVVSLLPLFVFAHLLLVLVILLAIRLLRLALVLLFVSHHPAPSLHPVHLLIAKVFVYLHLIVNAAAALLLFSCGRSRGSQGAREPPLILNSVLRVSLPSVILYKYLLILIAITVVVVNPLWIFLDPPLFSFAHLVLFLY